MTDWIDVAFWGIGLAWACFTVSRLLAVRRLRRLPPLGESVTGERVSVIVTARDEERRIENTVLRLLAQREIRVEIVVVDDRSSDRTPNILARLAGDHAAIRVVRVDVLPDGWLGKTHACRAGAAVATGDWLLFTDADAWMAPDLVARAVDTARRDRTDHLSLFPREHRPNFFARAAHVWFAVLAAALCARINRGARGAFAGIGAFNLVRADAYREVGGHDRMKLAVVDDLELGLAIYRAGFRTRLYEAFDDLVIEWAPDLRALVRVFEKNFFALFGFNVALALFVVVGLSTAWAGAAVGPFTGRVSGIAAGIALAAAGLPGLTVAGRVGFRSIAACLSPLTMPVLIAAIANSTIKTLARGGIRWRDTFYPLGELSPAGIWRSVPPGLWDAVVAPKPSRPVTKRA